MQPIELLTSDDYFTKNPEFTSWLRVKHGRSFNDLAGDESHLLFEKFVDEWNNGLLPKTYYAGLAGTTVRTTHNWALRGKSTVSFVEDPVLPEGPQLLQICSDL